MRGSSAAGRHLNITGALLQENACMTFAHNLWHSEYHTKVHAMAGMGESACNLLCLLKSGKQHICMILSSIFAWY